MNWWFLSNKRLRTTIAPFIPGTVAALAVAILLRLGAWEPLELTAYRFLFWLRGAQTWDERVVVIAIDDVSLKELGTFPLPRQYYVDLLETLIETEASTVVFDVLLPESSAADEALAIAMLQQGRVVLAFARDQQQYPIHSTAVLQDAAIAEGHILVNRDSDGLVRAVVPQVNQVPTLGLVATQVYSLVHTPVPLPKLNQPLWVNWPGPVHHLQQYSLVDVIRDRIPAEAFADKIVFVGMTATGVDPLPTPFDRNPAASGVHLHAAIAHNLLQQNLLIRPSDRWLILLLFLVGPLLSKALSQQRLSCQLWLWFGICLGWGLIGLIGFQVNYWLPIAVPLVLFGCTGGSVVFLDWLKAEARLQARNEFLTTVSHEIRTPMNAVIGMTELLLRTPLSDQQRQFTQTIHSSGEALLTLINDLLDFAKLESGRLELEEIPFSLRDCIEQSVAIVASQAADKGLHLNYHLDPQLPTLVQGDPNRLRQILLNLLSNAVKFTAQGEITLTVTLVPFQQGRSPLHRAISLPQNILVTRSLGKTEAESQLIEFAVQDSGIGIAADRLERLFQPFRQVEAATSRLYGGTGLGLAISQQLVQRMGGTLRVESQVNVGSTFYVLLPLSIYPESEATIPPLTVIPPQSEPYLIQILLAEDNAVNQTVAVHLLQELGYTPTVANTGRAVLEQMQQQPYDLILMDVQMPEMNGLEATQLIRRQWPSNQQPYIVAMTASGLDEDRRRCREVGMNDSIHKPLRSLELAQVLQRYRLWRDRLPVPLPAKAAMVPASEPEPTHELPSPTPPQPQLPRLRSLPTLDLKVFQTLQEIMETEAEVIALIECYFRESADLLEKVAIAIQQHQFDRLHQALHTLKSSSDTIGAARLAQLCRDLEYLKQGETSDVVDALYQQIITEYEQVKATLQAKYA